MCANYNCGFRGTCQAHHCFHVWYHIVVFIHKVVGPADNKTLLKGQKKVGNCRPGLKEAEAKMGIQASRAGRT